MIWMDGWWRGMEKGGRLGWSKREGREGKGKTERKKKVWK